MDTAAWPTLLAGEFAPLEEELADEIARRYALGGRLRRSLLAGSGEHTGGFGGTVTPGELVQILEALKHCGTVLLAVLEQPAVGSLTGLGGLLASLVQLRQGGHRQPAAGSEPPATPGQPEAPLTLSPSPELIELVDRALDQLAGQFAADGRSDAAASDRARRLLRLLARDPASAAGFVRGLDRSLSRPAGTRSRRQGRPGRTGR